MGRKAKDKRALTGAERQRAYRQRKTNKKAEFVAKVRKLYEQYKSKLSPEELDDALSDLWRVLVYSNGLMVFE